MISISEIAKMANVSKMTVSNVINKKYDKVSQETIERIEKIIKETGYTPSLFARSLKSNHSRIVMLAIPQTIDNDPYKNKAFNNPFYGEIINSIEYNLREKGYFLMFRFIDNKEVLQNLVVNWNIDGVIILGAVKKEMDTIFKGIKVPAVYLDTYVEDDKNDYINTDDVNGGFLATDYLIKQGRKKVGIVVSPMDQVGVASKRFDGYKKALEHNNLQLDQSRIFEGNPSLDFGNRLGKDIKENIHNFDALFVYSDIMALSTINGLKNQGINIPEEIAIVGFDGLYIGELSEPKLTTVKQDITTKGEKAVELLLRKINKESLTPEKWTIGVKLEKRQSA